MTITAYRMDLVRNEGISEGRKQGLKEARTEKRKEAIKKARKKGYKRGCKDTLYENVVSIFKKGYSPEAIAGLLSKSERKILNIIYLYERYGTD